eukprot:TRINITY_DN13693_c0_g1_i1.p2 TRINITY_DN13693_c0_g1~~TRINITY_DN13693_c0_g1_i1.p2  ORF type:complete len:354 (+),score=93.00 TRINITY_DN13693_c0_g1_i1:40-1101(+)
MAPDGSEQAALQCGEAGAAGVDGGAPLQGDAADGGGAGAATCQGPPPDLVPDRDDYGAVPSRPVAVTVIRHAEGEHNVVTSGIVDAMSQVMTNLKGMRLASALGNGGAVLKGALDHCRIYDPSLTEAGVAQAVAAAGVVGPRDFDVVYCSPMLRTVQTALYIFGMREDIKIVLHPGCCETRVLLEGSNAGRPRSALMADVELFRERCKFKAAVDAAMVPEGTWWVNWAESAAQLDARAAQFRDFLTRQPHDNVALVSHGTFLKVLTEESFHMENCAFKSYSCTPYGMVSAQEPARSQKDPPAVRDDPRARARAEYPSAVADVAAMGHPLDDETARAILASSGDSAQVVARLLE